MNKNTFLRSPCLIGVIILMTLTGAFAAPLAWFPGPAVDPPFSGAATVVDGNLGNVIIGGDGYAGYDYALTYPENLVATNQYWNYLPAIDTLQSPPGPWSPADLSWFMAALTAPVS